MTTRRIKKPLGAVSLVGIGPGDLALLTLRAEHVLATADLVVTDASIPDALLERARPDAEIRNAEELDVAAVLITAAREGRAAVRLLRGDGYLTGGALHVAEALHKAKVGYEVVPGVPSGAALASYAGVPATAETGGGILVADPEHADWPTLAAGQATVVIEVPDAAGVIAAVTALLAAGAPATRLAALILGGGSAAQRTFTGPLGELVATVKAAKLTVAGVLVVGDVVKRRDRLSWFEARPLFGWNVLVPRTRAQSGETSDLLRALGASPLEVPTIAVEPPRTPAPMERAIRGLVSGRYAWVAFTSTNAVKAVREKLEEFGLDARAFAGVKLAAIGEATAEALASFGIRPDLVPSGEQSSDGLLADWPPYDDVFDPLDRVFLPRADIATETLVAGLKERGWAVDDITAYRTVRATPPPAPIREAIKAGRLDAVLFTSSSTVRNLLGIAGKPHESTVICCIGPATASTAREMGLRVDVLAAVATVESLTMGLADFALARRAEQAGLSQAGLSQAGLSQAGLSQGGLAQAGAAVPAHTAKAAATGGAPPARKSRAKK